MTVRRYKSPLASAAASIVGSIRIPLNLAISFKRWRQVVALICKGAHLPKGRVRTLGTGPDITADEADIEGGMEPIAGIAYETSRGRDNIIVQTYKLLVEAQIQQTDWGWYQMSLPVSVVRQSSRADSWFP